MKKKNNFLRFLLLPFLSLFIGLNIYYWNTSVVIGNQLPMPFGYGASIVLSGSMSPALEVNDLIIIKEFTEETELALDDIIVFEDNGFLVVHRIVEISETQVCTQGDANNVPDDYIDKAQIRGMVIGKLPQAGIVVDAIKSPIGIISIIGLSLILLEMSYKKEKDADSVDVQELREAIRQIKENMEEKGGQ